MIEAARASRSGRAMPGHFLVRSVKNRQLMTAGPQKIRSQTAAFRNWKCRFARVASGKAPTTVEEGIGVRLRVCVAKVARDPSRGRTGICVGTPERPIRAARRSMA